MTARETLTDRLHAIAGRAATCKPTETGGLLFDALQIIVTVLRVLELGGEGRGGHADLAYAGASEGAVYAFPEAHQAALRDAFCIGSVFNATGKLLVPTLPTAPEGLEALAHELADHRRVDADVHNIVMLPVEFVDRLISALPFSVPSFEQACEAFYTRCTREPWLEVTEGTREYVREGMRAALAAARQARASSDGGE